MVQLLGRKLPPFFSKLHFAKSGRSKLVGVLALAAVGGGSEWLAKEDNHHVDTSVSVSLPFIKLLLQPWLAPRELPHTALRDQLLGFGHQPLKFSGAGPLPSKNSTEDVFKADSDDTKCCPGCLGRNSIASAAALVGSAVVNLSVTQDFHGMFKGKSIGSGTIIDPDGTILTCAHVVADFQGTRSVSKGKVDVTLQDGRTFEGVVVNADFISDIAVVKIQSKTSLPAAKLGSSSRVRPGEWVVALGCPLSLQNTITAGIVSCVDRKSSDLGLGGMRREYLQTDCAINEGNSGGPLVNLDGEVVGVNIMKIKAADGLSFAVPIDSVAKIIDQFRKNGRVVRPWLGLKMFDLNDMIIAQLKERDPSFPDVRKGVLIPMVTPRSPADRAGFRPGDIVLEFEGRPIESLSEIIEIMEDNVGKPLRVLVKRANNKTALLTVVPEEANPEK
ncbi:putative protease Do-like 14 [Aristolochia californica]|uniref:putative protease Do-like 14 n=1 Tax=Aristolochia californica TaxID=171875 RepID=UPI0035E3267B